MSTVDKILVDSFGVFAYSPPRERSEQFSPPWPPVFRQHFHASGTTFTGWGGRFCGVSVTLTEQLQRWTAINPIREIQREIPQKPPERVVVSGRTRWEPVDRQAAMLLAKSPDICKWHGTPKHERKNAMTNSERAVSIGATKKLDDPTHKTTYAKIACEVFDHGATHELVNKNTVAETTAAALIAEAETKLEKLQKLRDEANEAVQLLFESTSGMGAVVQKFSDDSKQWVQDIRQTRFFICGELQQTKRDAEDLRRFFGSSEHDKQLEKMKEFVDVCEKLKQLKDSGFLDSVVETMIKL